MAKDKPPCLDTGRCNDILHQECDYKEEQIEQARKQHTELGKDFLDYELMLKRLDALDRDVSDIKRGLKTVTNEVFEVKKDTNSLLEAFRSLQGFMNVINFMYTVSKPIMWFVFACASLYYLFNGIKLPIPK